MGSKLSQQKVSIFSSSEEKFTNLMFDYKKQCTPNKVLRTVEDFARSGMLSQNMALIAMKTLQRINRTDLSPQIVPHWLKSFDSLKNRYDCDESTSISIVRAFCKLQQMEAAETVANKLGVIITESNSNITSTMSANINLCNAVLPELSLGYISNGSQFKALTCLSMMKERNLSIEVDVSKKILKQFLYHSKSFTIRKALRILLDLNGLNDHDSIQLIANNYLRNLDFVKGAVSLDTLPPPSCCEVAFMAGRMLANLA